MKKLLLIVVLICGFYTLSAQQISINNFSRLEAVGQLPNDLLNIAKGNNFDGSKPRNRIQRNANRYIKDLIISGRVVYGDTVTHYLEKILDNLLVNDPALRKEIKIYTLKSSEVNAFATIDGFVFVTVGFISQSTCEAEIAYVLSHELIHYVKKHGYNTGGNDKDGTNTIEDYLKYHSRSREQEFEADKLGYEKFFKNSGYASNSIDGMFDVLQYSYLPFDELKLNRGMFENEYYKFEDNYFLESVTPIVSREDYIDTFSTHPNLKSRRAEMENLISASDITGDKKFIQSQEDFNFIRTISRFETINQQIIADNYIKAYYNTLCLLKNSPDNKFLNTASCASLYGIARGKISGSYQDIDLGKDKTEGEMQFAVNLFKKMGKKELGLMSLRSTWNDMKLYPDDKYFKLLFNDITKYLVEDANLGSLNKFSDYKMGEIVPEDTLVNEDKEQTKYDKVKTKKLVGHQKSFKTENYMLGDLKKDEAFVKAFNSSILENEQGNASSIITYLKEDNQKTSVRKKIIILKPYAEKIHKSENKTLERGENKIQTQRLERRVKNIAKQADFEPILISSYDNDFPVNYQLLSRLNDYSRSFNKFSDITYESRDAENLAKELGTPILNLVYYQKQSLGSTKNKKYKRLHSSLSIMTPPTIPISIYQWFAREQSGKLLFIAYDLEKHKTIFSETRQFEHENTYDEINQELYECYIKTSKLSKN